MRRFGSGRVGFWTRHRRASHPCFCWMPTVTSPTIHGQSRSVSTAAKETHSTVSVWENSCGTTICKRRTHTSQVGATFFGPFVNTQIDFACLPAALHAHRCCALHHDGDRLQLAAAPGRRDHRLTQCVFQHQLTHGTHEKRQDHQWDKNKLTQGALFAQDRTPFLARVLSMPARRGVDRSDSHRFLGETQPITRGRRR